MIHIRQECIDEMIKHAQEGYPHEVVGILAGDRDSNCVAKVQTLQNERGDTNNRYAVSSLMLMRAERALEAEGLGIVGYYHSHPDHTAQYSAYDRDHALPNMSYVILSIEQGLYKNILSWRLAEDRSHMHAEDISIQ